MKPLLSLSVARPIRIGDEQDGAQIQIASRYPLLANEAASSERQGKPTPT